ncbi:hypothetical protein BC941DRAFT_426736 [Chlamydoabsidia padenii]|nr:hypothetical protein BC941DRAFT_426736 [Chlamydoabsidia padenii]
MNHQGSRTPPPLYDDRLRRIFYDDHLRFSNRLYGNHDRMKPNNNNYQTWIFLLPYSSAPLSHYRSIETHHHPINHQSFHLSYQHTHQNHYSIHP